jgi:hypothetical protein
MVTFLCSGIFGLAVKGFTMVVQGISEACWAVKKCFPSFLGLYWSVAMSYGSICLMRRGVEAILI